MAAVVPLQIWIEKSDSYEFGVILRLDEWTENWQGLIFDYLFCLFSISENVRFWVFNCPWAPFINGSWPIFLVHLIDLDGGHLFRP